MTYGGNEEIVLKDQKELENLKKQEKTEKLQSQRMYMHNVHQVFFWNTDFLQRSKNGYAAADVGQREYNIYKGQKKYPGQKLYSFWKRQSKDG
jgi:hypothetical protein